MGMDSLDVYNYTYQDYLYKNYLSITTSLESINTAGIYSILPDYLREASRLPFIPLN